MNTPLLLVQRDDLVQPFLGGVAHDRQRRARHAPGEADELGVRQHLVGEQVDHFAHRSRQAVAPEEALQVGDGCGRP